MRGGLFAGNKKLGTLKLFFTIENKQIAIVFTIIYVFPLPQVKVASSIIAIYYDMITFHHQAIGMFVSNFCNVNKYIVVFPC